MYVFKIIKFFHTLLLKMSKNIILYIIFLLCISLLIIILFVNYVKVEDDTAPEEQRGWAAGGKGHAGGVQAEEGAAWQAWIAWAGDCADTFGTAGRGTWLR